jgi:hypothetical protein
MSDISRAFADRNSLLAGNLAGNLQNRAEFALFGVPARLVRVKYQHFRLEFPVTGKTGDS